MTKQRLPFIVKEKETTLINLTEMAKSEDGFHRLISDQQVKPTIEEKSSEAHIWIMHTKGTEWLFELVKPLLTNWPLHVRRQFTYPKRQGAESWIIIRGSSFWCYTSKQRYESLQKHSLEIHWE